MTEEYFEAAETFAWPDGYVAPIPADPGPWELEDGTQALPAFERGYGVGEAAWVWKCAWQLEWLTVRESDPVAAEHALDTLETWTEIPNIDLLWDPGSTQVLVREGLDQARMGDATAVTADVLANCGHLDEQETQ